MSDVSRFNIFIGLTLNNVPVNVKGLSEYLGLTPQAIYQGYKRPESMSLYDRKDQILDFIAPVMEKAAIAVDFIENFDWDLWVEPESVFPLRHFDDRERSAFDRSAPRNLIKTWGGCPACGGEVPHYARGLCRRCYYLSRKNNWGLEEVRDFNKFKNSGSYKFDFNLVLSGIKIKSPRDYGIHMKSQRGGYYGRCFGPVALEHRKDVKALMLEKANIVGQVLSQYEEYRRGIW